MPVIGIDLGTSNTCAAVVANGNPQVILDEKGRATLPSVMSLNRKGQFYVGYMAKAQMAVQPELTVHSAKRLLGQRYNSVNVQQLMPFLSYATLPTNDGMTGVVLADNFLTPTEISAAILKKVKALAEAALGTKVDQAVISVPAHFDNIQRQETKKAAEIAGLQVTRLINEPTAAALAYGFGTDMTKIIAVYDFGGGTFDISVLEIGEGIYNVLATGGDTFLGGNDFNQAIANWVYDRFKQRTKIDLSYHTLAKQRVLDASEFAKMQLSSAESTHIELPSIVPDIDPSLSINEVLTRMQLESLCAPFVDRSLRICRNVFDSAGIDISEVDEVIMVGGMTRMPLIRNKVQEWFGLRPNTNINPDEAVGIGAAIQAMALDNEEDMVLLLDVIPLTLSIEAAGGVCIPLIHKNTKVPHRVSRVFSTSRDDQDSVIISIYQGEGSHTHENTLLATFELGGIRPAKRMEPKIEVSLRIDVSGILSVTAMDLDTKQSQSVQVVDMSMKALEALEGN
jgi:molecular chaperone DnaK